MTGDDTWIYPAPAWRHGDRVAIENSSRDDYDETGTVVGPEPYDDDAWLVRLDNGDETTADSDELTGLIEPAQKMPRPSSAPSPERTHPDA